MIPPKFIGANNAHIGDQGELWFAAALPRGWVWQPPRRDFGKDGLIVIRDATKLHNIEFSVQIKTSAQPLVRDGYILLSGIARSAVQYWFASPIPTLVVAVDISTKTGWFAWHLDLFRSPKELFGKNSKTVTVRIPAMNQLNETGWDSIRKRLVNHFETLQQALWNDAIISSMSVTVNNIARIIGNLMRIASRTVPNPPLTEDETMTLLIEQMEIRDLIDAVRTLLKKIDPSSEAHKQIEFLLTSFEETAIAAHPSVHALPPKGHGIPADLELAFAPKLLLEGRPKLVLAAVDLLRLLTSPRPPAKAELSDTTHSIPSSVDNL